MKETKRLILISVLFLLPSFLWASSGGEGGSITHHMTQLVIQLSLIMIAARLGGSCMDKFGQPRVLGEIIAGMLIGPYMLGAVHLPGFAEGIFPVHGEFPVSKELYGLTTVASIILLFIVGLETDIDTFLRFSLAGSMVGIGGVFISFIAGDAITVFLSEVLMHKKMTFTSPTALFMGVISTATSVGISARILSERKKMDSPEGVTILAGAVIDDVLGIIMLAIILGVIGSGHVEWAEVSVTAVKAIGIWLGTTVVGLFFSKQISSLLKLSADKGVIALMGLAMAFLLAGIFEKSGLAMIVGGYVMGLSLSKTDISFVIQDQLHSLYNFFVPVFFCVMGMLVDFSEFTSFGVIMFGLIYIVVAVVSKVVGCGLPALFLNFNLRGALRIGVGMTPRGEVGMIIAGIALASGSISHDFFGIAVMMTFITTLFTPPVLSRMLASDKKVLRKEKPSKASQEEIIFEMPNKETQEFIISKMLEAFEHEGFFIQHISGTDIYQIRKNDLFLILSYTAKDMNFLCSSDDSPFVHTVFYEVIAEQERVMKKIQALSYREEIGEKMFTPVKNSSSVKSSANSDSFLHRQAVRMGLEARDKDAIMEELLDLLIRGGKLHPDKREDALKDLQEREQTMSTGMQNGIALPHARTDAVKHLACAVGVIKEGVDFDSLDGKASNIFVLTVSPKDAHEPHLQVMSSITQALMTEEKRNSILTAPDDETLYRVLKNLL